MKPIKELLRLVVMLSPILFVSFLSSEEKSQSYEENNALIEEEPLLEPLFPAKVEKGSSEKEKPKGLEGDSATWTSGGGRVKVTAETKNTDFGSRCRHEWEKARKKDGDSKDEDDKKGSSGPSAKVTVHWSSEDP